jgi:hypothetical protein
MARRARKVMQATRRHPPYSPLTTRWQRYEVPIIAGLLGVALAAIFLITVLAVVDKGCTGRRSLPVQQCGILTVVPCTPGNEIRSAREDIEAIEAESAGPGQGQCHITSIRGDS